MVHFMLEFTNVPKRTQPFGGGADKWGTRAPVEKDGQAGWVKTVVISATLTHINPSFSGMSIALKRVTSTGEV